MIRDTQPSVQQWNEINTLIIMAMDRHGRKANYVPSYSLSYLAGISSCITGVTYAKGEIRETFNRAEQQRPGFHEVAPV